MRDVWEWSLSDFPQINHFVQSPEDPTVKNTAQGRGDRRRKRQEGGVGKDMGWERRMSRERRARGKGKKGERARKGQGILSGQRASLRPPLARSMLAPRWRCVVSKLGKITFILYVVCLGQFPHAAP